MTQPNAEATMYTVVYRSLARRGLNIGNLSEAIDSEFPLMQGRWDESVESFHPAVPLFLSRWAEDSYCLDYNSFGQKQRQYSKGPYSSPSDFPRCLFSPIHPDVKERIKQTINECLAR